MALIGKEGITAVLADRWAESKEEELGRLLLESVAAMRELAAQVKIANERITRLEEENIAMKEELERVRHLFELFG